MNRHERRKQAARERHAFSISDHADIEGWCSRLAAARAPQLPLYRAAADGLIGVMFIYHPGQEFPTRIVKTADRPVCILLGADLGAGDDPPPAEWRCAPDLKKWCHSAIIHAAGGLHEHYRWAAAQTCISEKLVLVETTSQRMLEWVEYLECQRTLLINPTDGPHPVTPSRGAMH